MKHHVGLHHAIKNIQHNGIEAFYLQKAFNTMGLKPVTYKKHSTQWDWSLLLQKAFNTMGLKPITHKKTFNTMGLNPITYKNIQHNGTEAYYLQKYSTQWDWSLLPTKNGLYYIFILLVNSFHEQCICFRESDNWSMVGLHKLYLKKWTARSFFLTHMIKRGFLKTNGLPEHAISINFKNHNTCIECDVSIKISDQFKVWKQDKESKLLRKDIILASQNPEHKDISNSKFSKHHVIFCWCLHWKRNKNSVYVASCVLTLAKTTTNWQTPCGMCHMPMVKTDSQKVTCFADLASVQGRFLHIKLSSWCHSNKKN
jgi:hypothetical protein